MPTLRNMLAQLGPLPSSPQTHCTCSQQYISNEGVPPKWHPWGFGAVIQT